MASPSAFHCEPVSASVRVNAVESTTEKVSVCPSTIRSNARAALGWFAYVTSMGRLPISSFTATASPRLANAPNG